ncbi:uncharacterized protein BJ212DRAFT_1482244 [Suillus subaureus]|uniref:Uncharacterized protein n=1 Tax=Suillus subaureus TaxID=48587 RepID=A0A9P7E803_9AGAM|nr:uncharacterized protein BJ212DRAFT_1482244 [Suillus subaureus]KAG1813896.1 hypothetical protein BJ212DRAFT_1482244 [Suillus subaureus]
MSHPQMHPSNIHKHPGNIVWEVNRVQWQLKEEVAAEKTCKQAEKDAHAAAVDKSHTTIAAAEDAMAIQQKAQVKGPPKLVQPHMVTSKKSTNLANVDAQPAVIVQSTAAPEDDSQASQPVKKKAGQLAESDVDLYDKPKEYSELAPKSYRGKNIVHVNETLKSSLRGKKHSLPNAESSADELEALNTTEELEILKDPEAAEEFEMVENRESAEEGNESDTAMMVDLDQSTINTQASMLVDVSELKTTTKQGKTKVKAEAKTEVKAKVKTNVVATEKIHAKIKKGKGKNEDLPSGVFENGLWCMRFLLCLMFWISNSNFGWTIPETKLKSVLEQIYYAV